MKQNKQLLESAIKELEDKYKKLEHNIDELEKFTSNLCNEFQGPLRKIKTYGQLVQDKQTTLSQENKAYLMQMIKGTEHMENIIDSFLEFLEINKKTLHFESVALNQVISNVVQQLESVIRESKAKISVAQTIPPVQADTRLMNQLFLNIISNSLKFCNKEPSIIVHYDIWNEFVRLMIQDNGVGIQPKYTEKIFAPFFKINSYPLLPGTGIGLAICKKIVERHGGHIFAESSEHLGTIIIVDLPVYLKSEEELLA